MPAALSCQPKLLIADEPTTALDVTVQAQILRLLRDRAQAGMAMLLITHDLGVIAQMAQQVVVMYAGRVVESGPTAEILRQPQHPLYPGLIARAAGARRTTPSPVLDSRQVPDPPPCSAGCAFADRCQRPAQSVARVSLRYGNNAAGRLLSHHIRGAGCNEQ